MEDHFGKYLRLLGSIFFLVIGFILAITLLLVVVRGFFGLLSYIFWISYVYIIFIILVPSTLFISAYLVYFKRTARHPHKIIKWVSYVIFSIALVTWVSFLVMDMAIFYKHAYASIGMYHSYNMIFLIANVACFFIVGIIQALTTTKEVDWRERSSSKFEG